MPDEALPLVEEVHKAGQRAATLTRQLLAFSRKTVLQPTVLSLPELVRDFEPAIRMEVHCRLRDQRLRRAFDSLDICQSVLASFFVRAASGQYELDTPGQPATPG